VAEQHEQHPSDPLVVAAVASNEPEAAMIVGLLKEAGIKAMTKPGTGASGLAWGAAQQRGIYVLAGDLERAQEALASLN
jgi:hypothetical protein